MNLASPILLRKGHTALWHSAEFSASYNSGKTINMDAGAKQGIAEIIKLITSRYGINVLITNIRRDQDSKILTVRALYCPIQTYGVHARLESYLNYGVMRGRSEFLHQVEAVYEFKDRIFSENRAFFYKYKNIHTPGRQSRVTARRG
jgi:hypothetical protein